MNPALLLLATLAIIYLAKRIYKYFVNPWENCPPGKFDGFTRFLFMSDFQS